MVLANWRRMPSVLFAKAWVTTGHIDKETAMAHGNFTEEQWLHASMLDDPLGLAEFMGFEAGEEPSIEELIANGEKKRCRVVWLLDCKDPSQGNAILPVSLLHPVEKRMCQYLFLKAKGDRPPRSKETIVLSRRSSKEVSLEVLRKHTDMRRDGTRKLKEAVPARTLKDTACCLVE